MNIHKGVRRHLKRSRRVLKTDTHETGMPRIDILNGVIFEDEISSIFDPDVQKGSVVLMKRIDGLPSKVNIHRIADDDGQRGLCTLSDVQKRLGGEENVLSVVDLKLKCGIHILFDLTEHSSW